MMLEFYNELQSGKGPVFLKLDHLHERHDRARSRSILHTGRAADAAAASTQGRGTDYRDDMIEMHISEIGFC